MQRRAISWCGAGLVTVCMGACADGTPTAPSGPSGPSGPPRSDGRNGTLYQGSVPASTGFTNDIYVIGAGLVGDDSDVEVCVWDYATIDGDEINLWVAGRSLVVNGDPVIRLVGSQMCWNLTLTTGYYYAIRIRALNEGSLSPNTGAIEVNAGYGAQQQRWEVPLLTDGEASLIIEP